MRALQCSAQRCRFGQLFKHLCVWRVTCLSKRTRPSINNNNDSAVLLDGLRNAVPTPHSVALCCMFGPLGVLSHLATRWVVTRLRGPKGAVLSPFA